MIQAETFRVVIPIRYESQRLPRKALVDIAGKPMIQHVYERALASGAKSVLIATDHQQVYQQAQAFGADVCMTAANHQSGTDRIAEAVKKTGYAADDIIVNLQGDKPLVPSALIQQVATCLQAQCKADIATLAMPVTTITELFNPNVVKVVRDADNMALYFSRAAIAWDRDNFQLSAELSPTACVNPQLHLHHIGLYAYRVKLLQTFVNWSPCALEELEKLEQLRALWYGKKIYVADACEADLPGVDTAADLARVRNYFT